MWYYHIQGYLAQHYCDFTPTRNEKQAMNTEKKTGEETKKIKHLVVSSTVYLNTFEQEKMLIHTKMYT